jgi:hypothetical protein
VHGSARAGDDDSNARATRPTPASPKAPRRSRRHRPTATTPPRRTARGIVRGSLLSGTWSPTPTPTPALKRSDNVDAKARRLD